MKPSPQAPSPPEPVDQQLQTVNEFVAPAEAVASAVNAEATPAQEPRQISSARQDGLSLEQTGETTGPPADWLARVQRTGPPAHWVERVRQGAPHLLNDAEPGLEPADAMDIDPALVNPAASEAPPTFASSEDDNQSEPHLPTPTPPAVAQKTQSASFGQRPVKPARLRPVAQNDGHERIADRPETAEPPDSHRQPTSGETDLAIPVEPARSQVPPQSPPAAAISAARPSPPPSLHSAELSTETSRAAPAIHGLPAQPVQPVDPIQQSIGEVEQVVSREVKRSLQSPSTEGRNRSSAAPVTTRVESQRVRSEDLEPREIVSQREEPQDVEPQQAVTLSDVAPLDVAPLDVPPRPTFNAGSAFEETQPPALSAPSSQTTVPHIFNRQTAQRTPDRAISPQVRPSRSHDHWPSLPEEPSAEAQDWARVWRERERRQRLDREQRGEAWNA